MCVSKGMLSDIAGVRCVGQVDLFKLFSQRTFPARYVDIALSRLSQELGTVLFDAGMGT